MIINIKYMNIILLRSIDIEQDNVTATICVSQQPWYDQKTVPRRIIEVK